MPTLLVQCNSPLPACPHRGFAHQKKLRLLLRHHRLNMRRPFEPQFDHCHPFTSLVPRHPDTLRSSGHLSSCFEQCSVLVQVLPLCTSPLTRYAVALLEFHDLRADFLKARLLRSPRIGCLHAVRAWCEPDSISFRRLGSKRVGIAHRSIGRLS